MTLDTTTITKPAPYSLNTYPLAGSSNIRLETLGAVTVGYSPASPDPRRPGVQLIYRQSEKSYTLVFGNAMSKLGTARDAGVYFQISDWRSDGFRGRWSDGGRFAEPPSGYFCAARVGKALGGTKNVGRGSSAYDVLRGTRPH
jgi:hypothetical protein